MKQDDQDSAAKIVSELSKNEDLHSYLVNSLNSGITDNLESVDRADASVFSNPTKDTSDKLKSIEIATSSILQSIQGTKHAINFDSEKIETNDPAQNLGLIDNCESAEEGPYMHPGKDGLSPVASHETNNGSLDIHINENGSDDGAQDSVVMADDITDDVDSVESSKYFSFRRVSTILRNALLPQKQKLKSAKEKEVQPTQNKKDPFFKSNKKIDNFLSQSGSKHDAPGFIAHSLADNNNSDLRSQDPIDTWNSIFQRDARPTSSYSTFAVRNPLPASTDQPLVEFKSDRVIKNAKSYSSEDKLNLSKYDEHGIDVLHDVDLKTSVRPVNTNSFNILENRDQSSSDTGEDDGHLASSFSEYIQVFESKVSKRKQIKKKLSTADYESKLLMSSYALLNKMSIISENWSIDPNNNYDSSVAQPKSSDENNKLSIKSERKKEKEKKWSEIHNYKNMDYQSSWETFSVGQLTEFQLNSTPIESDEINIEKTAKKPTRISRKSGTYFNNVGVKREFITDIDIFDRKKEPSDTSYIRS